VATDTTRATRTKNLLDGCPIEAPLFVDESTAPARRFSRPQETFEMTETQSSRRLARRLFGLTEPIAMVLYAAPEPTAEVMALGYRNYWDTYFAGRAAPLGRVPAEVVHAIFYNFADGEVARHIPHVWDIATPEAVLAARERGAAAAVRRILADLTDSPGVARAADLATLAATSARFEGRPLFAAHRTLPIPDEPVARLWHAANLLREHRGDGHVVALVSEGIGGLESHALHAVSQGMPAEKFGRIHHLPAATLANLSAGMRARGLLDEAGRITESGRATKERVEGLTDDLAAPAYQSLAPTELDQLIADLEPLAAALDAVGSE
jgi:hypothetical protein